MIIVLPYNIDQSRLDISPRFPHFFDFVNKKSELICMYGPRD